MPKIGLIARCDKSGLGSQTLRLARLLNPAKIMLIDSTSFNGNQQYPDWYTDYSSSRTILHSFPTRDDICSFLEGIDIALTCELFYHTNFTEIARSLNVKTICIANPEFFDWFRPDWSLIPLPDKVIVPSYWMLDVMKPRFNAEYLPTPIFYDEFKQAREINLKRNGRPKYLFINGKTAIHDRNGLESLYEALQLSKGDFTMTVKAQNNVKRHPDPRLIYDFTNPENQAELYTGFDALIQPRRYGGQTLSMCEALMSGLPVVMTDIDPNNMVLPPEWLVPASKTGEFMTRTVLDIFAVDVRLLSQKLDSLHAFNEADKQWAYRIAQQYDAERLRSKYMEILREV